MTFLQKFTISCPHCSWEKSWSERESMSFHNLRKWQQYKHCPKCHEYTLMENDIYQPSSKQQWLQKVLTQ